MKKTFLAIALSSIIPAVANAGGNAGGSTEVTQIMNNVELLNITAQTYQNYRTMVSRLQIQAQNALTAGINSLRPEELMYYVDEITQMGRVLDSVSSAAQSKLAELESYSKRHGYGDDLDLKTLSQKNRENREKMAKARAEALAQVGMTQQAFENRQQARARIKQLMDSPDYGTEKALRTLQLLAEQQLDASERQLSLLTAIAKADKKIEQTKQEEEADDKRRQLQFMGFKTDEYNKAQ